MIVSLVCFVWGFCAAVIIGSSLLRRELDKALAEYQRATAKFREASAAWDEASAAMDRAITAERASQRGAN